MKSIRSFKKAMLIMQMVKYHEREYKPFCIVLEKCAILSEDRRPPFCEFMTWQGSTKKMLRILDWAEVQVDRCRSMNFFPFLYQYKECKQFLKQYRSVVKKWYWLFPLIPPPPHHTDAELVKMGLSHDPWPSDFLASRRGASVRIKG